MSCEEMVFMFGLMIAVGLAIEVIVNGTNKD